LEVEKKFVVAIPNLSLDEFDLLPYIGPPSVFTDLYVGSLRLRFSEDTIIFTSKTGSGVAREENEFWSYADVDIQELQEFIKNIPRPKITGTKTRFDFYPEYPLPRNSVKNVNVTFDDYGVHGDRLVFIMEIEAEKLNPPITTEEAIANIDKAFAEIKTILPEGTQFMEVTGLEQYSNRALIANPNILKPWGFPIKALTTSSDA